MPRTSTDELLARGVSLLEALAETTGRVVAWLTLVMVVVTFLVVLLRYGFDFGRIWVQELSIWAHGLLFMLAAAYTLKHDEHVRVDVVYRAVSSRQRAWIDLLGTLLLLIPTCLLILWTSWGYAASSWAIGEASQRTGGLPGLYLLKTAIPLMAVLLLVQGLAMAGRALLALRGRELPRDQRPEGEGL